MSSKMPQVGDIILVWYPESDIPKRAAIVTSEPDDSGVFFAITFTNAYAKEGGTQRTALHLDRLGVSWDYKA